MRESECNPTPASAALLAGGRSSRFGSDKARVHVHGVPLLRRNHALLTPAFDHVAIVGPRADAYADLGLVCTPDDTPHRGPMAGVIAALEQRLATRGPGPVAICACDTLLSAQAVDQIQHMAAALADSVSAAAVAGHDGHRWQPLFAAYSTHALPSLHAALSAGRASLTRWLDDPAHAVVRHHLVQAPATFNTPEELAQIQD